MGILSYVEDFAFVRHATTDFKTKMFVASKKFASARALLNTGVRARAAYELLEYS